MKQNWEIWLHSSIKIHYPTIKFDRAGKFMQKTKNTYWDVYCLFFYQWNINLQMVKKFSSSLFTSKMFSILFTRGKSVATMKSKHSFEIKYQVVILRKDHNSWREICRKVWHRWINCINLVERIWGCRKRRKSGMKITKNNLEEILENAWRSIRDWIRGKIILQLSEETEIIYWKKLASIKYYNRIKLLNIIFNCFKCDIN